MRPPDCQGLLEGAEALRAADEISEERRSKEPTLLYHIVLQYIMSCYMIL